MSEILILQVLERISKQLDELLLTAKVPNPPAGITATAACQRLECSRSKLGRYIARGLIRSTAERIGRETGVLLADVEKLFATPKRAEVKDAPKKLGRPKGSTKAASSKFDLQAELQKLKR